MMRPARFALVIALVASGCARATAIGTPCVVDKDCNVKGQRCVAQPSGIAICTHACTGQTGAQGCPIGYDCTAADSSGALTCNQERFAYDAVTGAPLLFGKDCSLQAGTTQAEWDVACAHTNDPAPSPTCRHAADPDSHATPRAPIRNDAHAYCTAGCARDSDCPVDLYCGADYDGVTKCLRRSFCDPCWMNDNCADGNDACVPTSDGSTRYCTKSCASQLDCGGVQGHFLSCATTTDSLGASATFCLHKFGACVGTGAICDPCRSDGDCSGGTRCVANLATGERMCTKSCFVDAECASDKPTGCDYGPPPANPGDPMHTDVCTGDSTHSYPGVLTCFF